MSCSGGDDNEILNKVENMTICETGSDDKQSSGPSEKALRRQAKELEKQRRKEETAARLAAEKAARESAENDHSKGKYSVLPVHMSVKDARFPAPWESVASLNALRSGEKITLRARIHTLRTAGSKLCFIVLRQQLDTVQAVLAIDQTTVSKQMFKFVTRLNLESIVIVRATVTLPETPVKSCSVSDAELCIFELHVESCAPDRLPFSLEDASRLEPLQKQSNSDPVPEDPEDQSRQSVRVLLDNRLNNRVLDLRTPANHAIFRIQSGICQLFREFLVSRDFVEIHTPKLLGAASEGGASVFEVKYFKGRAYLAQSPQFYKQMMIAADFPRVFEIAPVFRAENANTHRHMTEFTGVDLEMTIERDYSEVLDFFDQLFRFIFAQLETRYARELNAVQSQHPFKPFRVNLNEPTLRLRYPEAVAMLRESGVEMTDYEDLSTEKERALGRLVLEKYDTDFFMLEKYPRSARPFYTMPCPENPMYSNSYDFFMRGEEIMSGAQRVHDPDMLRTQLLEHGVDPETVSGYLNAFRFAAPPHAGGGIGLERIVMLYLCLNNIRRATLFPRDPSRLEP